MRPTRRRAHSARLQLILAAAALFALVGSVVLLSAPVLAQEGPAPSPTFDAAQVTVPLAPPSARVGRSIYLENCAPCHGQTGNGDGPTAPELTSPPTVFSDPDSVWQIPPAELFHTTKFGRLQNMMPPWRNQLDDGQIWDAVWYAWSLHTSEAEVGDGEQLYAESCQSCHGEQGRGDGPAAAQVDGGVRDLSEQSQFISASNNDWLLGWQEAHNEVGGDWSVAQQTAAIEYMRTFGYAPPWQSPYEPGTGAIRGSVVAGSEGGPQPAGLVAAVDAFLEFDQVASFTTTVDAEGGFAFTNLATDPNLNYIVSALSDGIAYSSDFITLTPDQPVAETEITVYATTDDATVLTVDRLHWIVESEPGVLLVGQIFAVGNTSDRTFVGVENENAPDPVTFAMQLPPNAQNVEFESGQLGERFHQVGPVIYDTLPVLPGQGTRQVIVRYVVPFEGSEVALDQALLYPVSDMSLLAADFPDLKVDVTGLEFQSVQQMGERAYQFWEGLQLEPQTISVALGGLPAAGDPSPFAAEMGAAAADATGAAMGAQGGQQTINGMPATRTPPPEPWMAALIAGVVVAGLAGVLLWARSTGALRMGYNRGDLNTLRDSLISQIAHIDDLHALGDIGDSEWMRSRAQLKAQLVDVLARLERGKQKT
jgi:mono/diheme cytochrome c family protein